MSKAASNVIPFRRPALPVVPARCDVVSVADDLLLLIDQLQDLTARAALTNRPAIEVERTVQRLLDAVGALEAAADCIGEGCEATPG